MGTILGSGNMKTILAAALLLCCFGTTAHATDYSKYPVFADNKNKQEKCSKIAAKLYQHLRLVLWNSTPKDSKDNYREAAAEWAAIYQAVCKD